MAALVNQTNVNRDTSFFTSVSSLNSGLQVDPSVTVSSVTFYGGGGTIQTGGVAPALNQGVLVGAPFIYGGEPVLSTLTFQRENLTPASVILNSLYLVDIGGNDLGNIKGTGSTNGNLTFSANVVSTDRMLLGEFTQTNIQASSINGIAVPTPNPRKNVASGFNVILPSGSTIVTTAPSTVAFAFTGRGLGSGQVYGVQSATNQIIAYGTPLTQFSYIYATI
jgi:hypothetical protein